MNINKKQLYNLCHAQVSDKVSEIRKSIVDARESSNNDTKSSMGDKYETTREMLQQQINMLEKQLAEASLQLYHLNSINPDTTANVIETGSLVETNIGNFYITISLGEINIDMHKVIVISPIAPLGNLLIGKKTGEVITMNKKEINIQNVY